MLSQIYVRGRFLDHERMIKDEALKMMVEYLMVDPREEMDEFDKTRDAHARFVYLKKVYEDALMSAQQADGDDEQVALYKSHALRAYLLYLVGTVIFMDKSATYTYIVYLRYFVDFERIHEYNWGRLVWFTCTRS